MNYINSEAVQGLRGGLWPLSLQAVGVCVLFWAMLSLSYGALDAKQFQMLVLPAVHGLLTNHINQS